MRIRDDGGFFQAVQSVLSKSAIGESRKGEDKDHAVRQIISPAVASAGVMDIFAAAGLEKPDISVLSDEFLAEVQGMVHRQASTQPSAEQSSPNSDSHAPAPAHSLRCNNPRNLPTATDDVNCF